MLALLCFAMSLIYIKQLTVLHLSNFPLRMLRACITITPEIIAFVVAMAGIIFPAMAKKKKRKIICYLLHQHLAQKLGLRPNRKYKIEDVI